MNKTIENLKKLKSFHNGSYGADIDKAIKALEQEPCEDCISREQAIKATYGFERYTGINEAPYEYAESILRDLPPVTPTQEPVLDKIRAEIDIARFIDKDTKICKNANASGLEEAMQIIDKYRAESEEI